MRARRRSATRARGSCAPSHDAGIASCRSPGPSAVAAAVSAAGLDAARFVFVGFLPAQAKARRELPRVARGAAGGARRSSRRRIACARRSPRSPRRSTRRARSSSRASSPRSSRRSRACRSRDAAAWLAADANRERGEFVLIVDAPTGGATVGRTSSPEALVVARRARAGAAAVARREDRRRAHRRAARRALRARARARRRTTRPNRSRGGSGPAARSAGRSASQSTPCSRHTSARPARRLPPSPSVRRRTRSVSDRASRRATSAARSRMRSCT